MNFFAMVSILAKQWHRHRQELEVHYQPLCPSLSILLLDRSDSDGPSTELLVRSSCMIDIVVDEPHLEESEKKLNARS